jgi:hypothetical protein
LRRARSGEFAARKSMSGGRRAGCYSDQVYRGRASGFQGAEPTGLPPHSTHWCHHGLAEPSEARRRQGLEIDRKEIARRNTQALERDKFDCHLSTPLLAAPGEALGESIDLIVVATGKRE